MNGLENIGRFIEEAAEKYGVRVCLKTERTGDVFFLTYDQVFGKACQFANFLENRGVKKGDRVGIWGSNSPEWVICYFGCLISGVVAVPIDLRTSKETISHFFITAKPVLGISEKEGEHFGDLLPNEVFFDDIADLTIGYNSDFNLGNVQNDDLAEIVYTSGTTGEPKGVAISHGGMLAGIDNLSRTFPLEEGWRLLSVFPLSHLFEEAIGLFTPLYCGASIFYLERLTSTSVMKAFGEEKITCMIVVPEFLRFMQRTIERKAGKISPVLKMLTKLSGNLPMNLRRLLFFPIHRQLGGNLEFLVSSGAYLDRKVRDFFESLGIRVYEGYGSTEMIAVSVDLNHEKSSSVGKILNNVEVNISDDDEILVKSPSLFKGYFGDPERTAKVFVDGFYHSGDAGRVDGDYLFLLGRDFYKIVLPSALKVYVEDVEKNINENSEVVESCVLGVKREEGNRVCAVLILKDKELLKSVIKRTNEKLEQHQQIMEYYVFDQQDFPRTPLLKIDRKKVLEWVTLKQKLV